MDISQSTKFAVVLLLAVIILAIYIYLKKFGNIDNIFKHNIYLDNNGTTMICQEALEAYNEGVYYGNASSTYAEEARNIIKKNDQLIKNWVKSDYNIIYTSGATESNNTIIKSLVDNHLSIGFKPHIILSEYEHKSSIECAKTLEKDGKIYLTLIKPNIYGFIMPNDVSNAVNENTILVSIMHVNNELGTINDIKNICLAAKSKNPNIFFHTDAVQSFGKFSIPLNEWNIDALSASYHKLYGPQGIGLLIVNNLILSKIQSYPLISGSQNHGARGGTINIAGINGGYAALSVNITNRSEKNHKLFEMKKYMVNYLSKEYNIGHYEEYVKQSDKYFKMNLSNNKMNEIIFLGDNPLSSNMSPNTLLLSIVKYGPIQNHFCNVRLKKDLQEENIIVSIGSACNSNNLASSHCLYSIDAPFIIRCGVIRISLGDYNTINEIKKFCKVLSKCIEAQNQPSKIHSV